MSIGVIAFSTSFSSHLLAFSMPTGIPSPDWGSPNVIDRDSPKKPSSWPSEATENYYYIDNLNVSATDKDNLFGSPDLPRKTIPEGNLAAGSYIEIHNGPYNGGGRISLNSLGTVDNPVWVTGDNENKAYIQGDMVITGSYAYIENLFFDTPRKTLSLRCMNNICSDHIVVRNNEFSGPGINSGNTSVLSVSGDDLKSTNNIILYNNHIYGFGDTSADASENDYHGIHIGANADYTWILNNHIHNNGGDSIQVGAAQYSSASDTRRPNYVFIGGNNFHEDGENAVDIKGADNIVISTNLMYGYGQSTSSAGEVVVIHNDPTNVWVLNNTIHTGILGIVVTGADNAWIIGNKIHNIHALDYDSWDPTSFYSLGSAIHFRSTINSGAINNTIYDFDNGIQLASGTEYTLLNNIIAYRSRADGSDIAGGYKILEASNIDNNLIYNDGGERIRRSNSEVLSLSGYKLYNANCVSCSDKSPQFIDYSNLDFNLEDDSPAINKGASILQFSEMNSLYKVNVVSDLSGEKRITGNIIDIGAFESPNAPSVELVSPIAPSTISLNVLD